jgi:hypothetical protein
MTSDTDFASNYGSRAPMRVAIKLVMLCGVAVSPNQRHPDSSPLNATNCNLWLFPADLGITCS